jgi:hypothetical protein
MSGYKFFRLFVFFLILFFSFRELAAAGFDGVVSVTWRNTPMRETLMRLAKANRIGLFIDRRIDPETLINFKAENKTVKFVFQNWADSAGFYCYFFGSVVYIGHGEMREIFPELITKHRKFIAQIEKDTAKNKSLTIARAKLQKIVTVKLPLLSEPKKILNNLALQHQFQWKNLDKIPHDVWDENILPPMQFGDLLVLMLIGFELDYVCELNDKNSTNKMILTIINIPKKE